LKAEKKRIVPGLKVLIKDRQNGGGEPGHYYNKKNPSSSARMSSDQGVPSQGKGERITSAVGGKKKRKKRPSLEEGRVSQEDHFIVRSRRRGKSAEFAKVETNNATA